LAADARGAWLVGNDPQGRSSLTHVLADGKQRSYPLLPGSLEAVATGLGAVWVIDRGARWDRLLRLDPATGTITGQARLPASARVDSLTVAFGDVWLVSSSTARLYRIDPRLAVSRPVHLACQYPQAQLDCTPSSTGPPSAMFGLIWVEVAANSGTVTINPRTLLTDNSPGIAVGNGVSVEAFDSAWTYDVDYGGVLRWDPADLVPGPQIPVTAPPNTGGSCLTSIAAASGAVWVTLAPYVGSPSACYL
jgi:hypothetical protein